MAKKITVRIDDETARKIDELSRKTQIPKVRLTKQAYTLLLSLYKQLRELYKEDVVDLNLMDFINNKDSKDSKDTK